MNNLKEWKEYCHFCEYHYSNFDAVSPNYSCVGSYLNLKENCIFRNKKRKKNILKGEELQIVEKAYRYFIKRCYTKDHSVCYLAELLRQYLKRFE